MWLNRTLAAGRRGHVVRRAPPSLELWGVVTNQSKVQVTTQAEEVLHSDVDGLGIATPVGTQCRLAKAALLHGKHELVEKPLRASVEEAEELVALAQELGHVLMVGYTCEYSPAVNQLRKLIQEDFANAIRQGIQPRAQGGVGLSVVQVLSAAQNGREKQRELGVTAKVFVGMVVICVLIACVCIPSKHR